MSFIGAIVALLSPFGEAGFNIIQPVKLPLLLSPSKYESRMPYRPNSDFTKFLLSRSRSTPSPQQLTQSPPKSRPYRIGDVLPARGLTSPPDHCEGTPVIWRIRTSSARIAVLDPQARPTAPPGSQPYPNQGQQARRIALTGTYSWAPPAHRTGGALQAAGYCSKSPVTPTRWCPGACSYSRAPPG